MIRLAALLIIFTASLHVAAVLVSMALIRRMPSGNDSVHFRLPPFPAQSPGCGLRACQASINCSRHTRAAMREMAPAATPLTSTV